MYMLCVREGNFVAGITGCNRNHVIGSTCTPPSTMSASFLLPRTFASTTGRNALRSALQGGPFHNLLQSLQLGRGLARRAASSTTAMYKGTVNDPTTFPPPSKTHGSYHWAFERLLSASLLPMTAAAFATSGSAYPVLDGLLGISLVMHSHIGVGNIANRFRRSHH